MKPFQAQTYYELLEVSVTASRAEIEMAYERLRHLYGDEQVALYGLIDAAHAAALRHRLKEAFEVLGDENRREEYDRAVGLPPRQVEAPPAPVPAAPREGSTPKRAHGWSSPSPYSLTWVQSAPAKSEGPPPHTTWAVNLPAAALTPPRPPVSSSARSSGGPALGAEPPDGVAESPSRPPASAELAPEASANTAPVAESEVSAPAMEAEPAPTAPAWAPSAESPVAEASLAAVEAQPPPGTSEAPVEVGSSAAPEPTKRQGPVQGQGSGGVDAEEPTPEVRPPASNAGLAAPGVAVGSEIQLAPARHIRIEPKPKPYEVPEGVEVNGDLLRQVRMARGLTLIQLSERTRISVKHLESVEADRYEALPVPVYLRGILMSLARELGLDGIRVAKSYLAFFEAHRSKG